MSLYRRNIPKHPVGLTEFEILKASHKFLRDEDEVPGGLDESQTLVTIKADDDKNATDNQNPSTGGDTTSWNEQLAAKYYASLYREFAVCNLKHYKTGNFALRWRTEDEVISGAGETTCGNARCEHHHPLSSSSGLKSTLTSKVPLTTLELPFCYLEHGKTKSALVKVVLCGGCLKKLMWKRNKEKERQGDVALGVQGGDESGEGGDVRDEGKEQLKQVISKKEEGAGQHRDLERERERSGKSKRKREQDIISEEERHQLGRRLRLQPQEDQSVSERRVRYGGAVKRGEKNETSARLENRRRSRSRSHSRPRDGYPSNNEVKPSSSFQHRHSDRARVADKH